MTFAAVAREIWTRLVLHSATGGRLEGLKVQKSGTYSIQGKSDLPCVTLVDMTVTETGPGSAAGTTVKVDLFLRTARDFDWFQLDATKPKGLFDWAEALMDAIERAPLTDDVDTRLRAHTTAGAPILKFTKPVATLADPITWDVRMAEITDLSFLLQLTISGKMTAGAGVKATRTTDGLVIADYA